jgi:hypothetical protein
MSLWTPSDDEDPDPAWWRPLELVTFVVAADRSLPTLDIGLFMLMGRADRRSRPRIWLYQHCETRRYLNLDDDANAYRYIAPRDVLNARSTGRYVRHRDLRTALYHAELHMLDADGGLSSFAADDWWSSVATDDCWSPPPKPERRLQLVQ